MQVKGFSVDQHQIFQALLQEGHSLFLSFSHAAPLIGAPSVVALRQAYRRGKCPIRVIISSTGTLGFSLWDISEYLLTGVKQAQPILIHSTSKIHEKVRRGAPKKAQRIANAQQEGDQYV
jgi:hypothetical protein